MAKNWDALAGETGRPMQTGRIGRALKLGRLATQVTGSVLANGIKNRLGPRGGSGNGSGDGDGALQAALRNADRIVQVMGEMKGAAMKIGQMVSADPDLVTPEFANRLASLQRHAPPMDFHTVRDQIEKAFDRKLPDLYRFFDPEPLGSASIGQVHRATLFDGRDVAVKVQYPGIVGTLESDLKNLGSLLSLGRVIVARDRLDEFLSEVREAILNEADYALEGRNLHRFHQVIGDRPGIRVPEPVMELTARPVLTMEYIAGEKLDEGLARIEDAAERNRIVTHFVETYVWLLHEMFLLHADPHPGNFLLDADHNVVLLDFGCVREFDPQLTDDILRCLVAFWDGDMERLTSLYKGMGFGTADKRLPEAKLLREYHDIILAPIKHHGPFDFGGWAVHQRIRKYLRQNLEMLRLVPPAEMILYMRVLTGIKGLLTRMNAQIDVRALAEEAARTRGLLNGDAL